jgi:sodium-coupled neutral amino acid transporter 10
MVRLEGMMSVLPLAIFAFGAHPAILPVTRAMRPAGLKPSVGVVTDVLRLCFVGYLMIGLGGYASFRAKTAGNVLRNTDGAFLGSFGSKALKSGYGIVILASVPTILLPLQKSARDAYLFLQPYVAPLPPGMSSTRNANHAVPGIDDLTTVPPEVANRLATVVAVTSMTCALYLSLYVPNVAFAFGLTGSTCSFLIAFVLPAASFLSATGRGARRLPGRGSARKSSLELEARGEAGMIMSGKKLAQTRDMSSDTSVHREELRRLRRGARRFVADAPERVAGGIRRGRVRRE